MSAGTADTWSIEAATSPRIKGNELLGSENRIVNNFALRRKVERGGCGSERTTLVPARVSETSAFQTIEVQEKRMNCTCVILIF